MTTGTETETLRERMEDEMLNLSQRFDWLERKSKRVQHGSNQLAGMRHEQQRLLAYGVLLDQTLKGEYPPPKLKKTEHPRLRRAWALLDEARHEGPMK